MWEESLAVFLDAEGFGKGREWERKKAERVLERDVTSREGEDFGADADLVLHGTMVVVQVLEYDHAVVAFEIMEDADNPMYISILVDCRTVQVVH